MVVRTCYYQIEMASTISECKSDTINKMYLFVITLLSQLVLFLNVLEKTNKLLLTFLTYITDG